MAIPYSLIGFYFPISFTKGKTLILFDNGNENPTFESHSSILHELRPLCECLYVIYIIQSLPLLPIWHLTFFSSQILLIFFLYFTSLPPSPFKIRIPFCSSYVSLYCQLVRFDADADVYVCTYCYSSHFTKLHVRFYLYIIAGLLHGIPI